MEKIVKYKNRKLYSKEHSKYVNLSYILDLVKLKSKFEVIAHENNKNVTNEVLKEAIVKLDVDSNDLVKFISRQV